MTDDGRDRRVHERVEATIEVDCHNGEHFLFAYITNISEMGIFIRSDTPMQIGTALEMKFGVEGRNLELKGEVVWINPVKPDGENLNPGMGVRFLDLTPEKREVVVDVMRTIAYIRDEREN